MYAENALGDKTMAKETEQLISFYRTSTLTYTITALITVVIWTILSGSNFTNISQEAWNKYKENIVNSYIEIPNYEGGTHGRTLAAKFYMVLDKSRYYHIAYYYN